MGRWSQYRHRGRGKATSDLPTPNDADWTWEDSGAGTGVAELLTPEFGATKWQVRWSAGGAGIWTEEAWDVTASTVIVPLADGSWDAQMRLGNAGNVALSDWSATKNVNVTS